MADLQILDAGDGTAEQPSARNSRRNFFKVAGGAAGAAALVVAGCDTAGVTTPGGTPGQPPSGGQEEQTIQLDFSSDVGVLNFAYALEQLEATFYVMACNNFYGGSEIEADYLAALRSPGAALQVQDVEEYYFAALRSHENAHAVFLQAAISAAAPDLIIPKLDFDFSSVDFSDRASVVGTASVLEDVGVSAYNGAGSYLESALYLTLAGKIVSVEARHAAAIRQLFFDYPEAFADLDANARGVAPLSSLGTDPDNALDAAMSPEEVIALAQPFIVQEIEVINA